MATHELKVWPRYYAALAAGTKTTEVRFGDDRAYAAGDRLWLREWDPSAGAYTGRAVQRAVARADRLEPAAFGAAGDPVWVLALGDAEITSTPVCLDGWGPVAP